MLIFFIFFASACKTTKMTENHIKAPIAEKKPKEFIKNDDVRIDNYYWLNERENPQVIAYLNAENAYYEAKTKHTKDFQTSLFEEMKARIKEDDESVPYKKNGYYYISRFVKGGQYPIFSRKKEQLSEPEEILFDVNAMAKDFDYFQLGGLNVSPNNELAAFSVDTVSRRLYTLQIKNLITDEIYPEKIPNTSGGSVWAADNKTLFYVVKNPTTLREEAIYKHVLGTDVAQDELVFFEKDDTFSVYITKSKSEKYLMIVSNSTVSTEYQILESDQPNGKFSVFQKRERDLEYDIDHYNGYFYIVTNKDKAVNFKVTKTPETQTSKENWVEVIPHRKDVLIEDMSLFKDFMVLEEREMGLNKIRITRWDGTDDYYLPLHDETYTSYTMSNFEFDTDILRYSYNSLTTPASVIDFNMKDKTFEVKKEQQVLGGKFDKNNYISQRLWATARDGAKVAISLVRHKNTPISSETPLLLYAYGSYGYTIDPNFSSTRLSLLDRGFIFAIAHVRGGEYLGREWYENGKLLHKKNTFYDFIDSGKYLVEQKYTSSDHLYAEGGSAGGLLMGAIVNIQPELFNGVIAQVPFVDVMTTMLDESIPLTTGEYDEWGNPNEKVYYDYMKSYSPYDNVVAQAYPNMLVTTGLHDSQVQYFEPAKWVAILRDLKTNNKQLYLYTDMETGHGGASGRFDALKEIAKEFAFLLDLEGVNQ
jgi:oligopeptidase B